MNAFRGMGLGSGIVLAVIGLVLFAFPQLSMSIFAILVGVGILVIGLNAAYIWYSTMRDTGTGQGVLITAVLSIIVAIVVIVNPLTFASAITWIVALAVIVFSVAQIISLATTRDLNGKSIGICGSLIVLLFGILSFVWPPFIMQFIGVSLLIEGITIIIMSFVSSNG